MAAATRIFEQQTNLVVLVETDHGPVVVKWFSWRHRLHYWLSPTFPGRAVTSWRIARRLVECGARTPEPLFLHSRRKRGFIRENLVITRAIQPHQTLRSLLKSESPISEKERAVGDLARSLARMHGAGIEHNDLTTGNFLVSDSGEVYIVDLNRAKRRTGLSTSQRAIDLARISFSAANQVEEQQLATSFFQQYGQTAGVDLDWCAIYWKYRARLVSKRRRKARIKELFGR